MQPSLRCLLLLLALVPAAPAPLHAQESVPQRASQPVAASGAPLADWSSGGGPSVQNRTGIIQICVIVAAVAILILIKRLN
jgi:hypothetical protein